MTEATWDPNQLPQPVDIPTLLGALFEPEQLVTLAEALGGGQYPGMGIMQNDTIPLGPDSVAPGFPLNGFFPLPGNLVKNKRVALSFQLSPYRTYYSTTLHSHTGDTIATVNIDHNHGTGNELSTHNHEVFVRSQLDGGATDQGAVRLESGGPDGVEFYLSPNNGLGFHPTTGADGGTHGDHAHTANNNGGVTLTSHVHNSISNTGSSNPSLGVQESTSPAGTTVLLDGTDLTSQLGGPFNAGQFELDLTPYINPAKGYHTVQLTSTQLGRVTGTVRTANIVNALTP